MTIADGPILQQGDSPLPAKLYRNLLSRRLLPITPTSRAQIVVGVSGGADSVCLLHALHSLSAERHLEIHVAHLNHGLRTESEREAAFVSEMAHQLNLPYHYHKLASGALQLKPGGVEAAARLARYAFLRQVAYNVGNLAAVPGMASLTTGAPIVAVAHNAEDQAETLLLHLVRGSGLRGLGGMRWKTEITGQDKDSEHDLQRPLWLIRPFLNVHRAEIEDYLRRRGLDWVEDASNQDTTYTRNHLRHRVLPLLAEINPRVVDALSRTAEIAGDASDRLDQADRLLLVQLLLEPSVAGFDGPAVDRLVLDRDKLAAMARPQQRGVLRVAIARFVQNLDEIDFETIERTLDQVCGSISSSGPHPLTGDLCWSLLPERIETLRRFSLHRASALPVSPPGPHLGENFIAKKLSATCELAVKGWRLFAEPLDRRELPALWRSVSPWHAWLDADSAGTPLLCGPVAGMRLAPLGMGGRTKALGDLFTDAKVHPTLRRGWPLIIDGDNNAILWVCGLHLAHNARVTDRTTRLLHLWWESEICTEL